MPIGPRDCPHRYERVFAQFIEREALRGSATSSRRAGICRPSTRLNCWRMRFPVVSSHPTTISDEIIGLAAKVKRYGRERSSALQDHRDEVSAQLAQLACRHGQNIFAVNPHFAVDPRLTRQQPHQGPQGHAFARAASPRMHSILAGRSCFGERYEARLIRREFAH